MEARKIQFSYNQEAFIDGLNVSIEKGKITTIIGPNGSGKSTLLHLFVNQMKPHTGSIVVNGQDIKTLRMKELAKKLAIVHQQNVAPMDITVEHLVRYGRTPYRNFFGSKDEKEDEVVEWALKATKLDKFKNKGIAQLSGGERQRAFIAMALVQKTDILFLDEPTTYLDIYYQMEILTLVKELNKKYNITIVMVLHDINQAIQFSHNVVIMKDGAIIYSGNAGEGITEERILEVYGIKSRIQWCDINKCPFMIPILH